eukprot:1604487-Lingulodinium_polyedra.AAC.1
MPSRGGPKGRGRGPNVRDRERDKPPPPHPKGGPRRPPPGGARSLRCLLCRQPGHKAVDCPTRYQTGSGVNNMQIGYGEDDPIEEAVAEALVECVTHWESEGQWQEA